MSWQTTGCVGAFFHNTEHPIDIYCDVWDDIKTKLRVDILTLWIIPVFFSLGWVARTEISTQSQEFVTPDASNDIISMAGCDGNNGTCYLFMGMALPFFSQRLALWFIAGLWWDPLQITQRQPYISPFSPGSRVIICVAVARPCQMPDESSTAASLSHRFIIYIFGPGLTW